MTAVSGVNNRSSIAYWELSGPIIAVCFQTCRACKNTVNKGQTVMVREGRKLRFFYHEECFTGDADPRTQAGSSFADEKHKDLHTKTAPPLSSLEGPRAYKDSDGRVLSRVVFKPTAPSSLGAGKWSVRKRGYNPALEALPFPIAASTTATSSTITIGYKKPPNSNRGMSFGGGKSLLKLS